MSKKELETQEASKPMTKYDRKMQLRKEAEAREKRQETIGKIVTGLVVFAIVAAIAMIPISSYIAKNATYITVGGHDITRVEFDYYYNTAKNNYINSMGSYLSYFGLDVNGDLSKQQYSENLSWQGYFEQMAVESIKQNKALVDAAKAEGFAYDTAADMKSFDEALAADAKLKNLTVSKYYRTNFGGYATKGSVRDFVEEGYIASAYYKELTKRNAPDDAAIQAYYEADKDSYDSVDYVMTEVAAEIPADESGSTANATEEEISQAMTAAKSKADEALKVIDEEGEAHTGEEMSSLTTVLGEWLFDSTRKAGDTVVLEDDSNNAYYAVKFEKRYLDDTKTANVRAIMSTTVSAEDMLAEYNASGANETAFIALVEKYSEDTYSKGNGGLYEELTKSSVGSALNDWVFAGRTAGEVGTVVEEGSNYLLYYVGDGRPSWKVQISDTLSSEAVTEAVDALVEPYTIEDPKGRLEFMRPVEETPVEDSVEEGDVAGEITLE